MTLIPVLETERLIMRAHQESDFESFASFFSCELSDHYGGQCDRNTAWRRLAAYAGHWNLRGFGIWALEDKASREFVGQCGLWFPEGWPEHEISWALMPGHTGKGYATEAANRALQFAYENLHWQTAISLIIKGNVASIRLAERLGASFESEYTKDRWNGLIYRHLDPQQHARACNYD